MESAVLNTLSDVLSSMDDDQVTALIVLNLSATFDAIDHSILLSRLKDQFGVTGKLLDGLNLS